VSAKKKDGGGVAIGGIGLAFVVIGLFLGGLWTASIHGIAGATIYALALGVALLALGFAVDWAENND
jgi:hypothetical protein